MNRNASYVSVAAALAGLTVDELLAIKKLAGKLVTDITGNNTYVVHMDDKDVPKRYRKTVAKWRKYAAALGYAGPVVWKVREGFTWKEEFPFAGRARYIHYWDIRNDELTKDSIVFWVPRLAEGSTNKTISQMETLYKKLLRQYGLSTEHVISFGSISLLFALIIAHFKHTDERVPLKYYYAASDTFRSDGYRLIAGGFNESGLYCGGWNDEHANDYVGFFLLGVELGI